MSLLRGTVIDNQDPMQRGRCRVYVWGMHREADDNLPWAETAGSTMFGIHRGVGYSGVLQVGTTVWVQFEQQDIQCPVIVGVFVGHDTDSPGDVSPENSDFNPDAKGDNYGKVWMFNTPAGNSFKMDDANPQVHIKTPNGFELHLDDANRRIRLGTPCGPEIVMECDGKLVLSSGCAKITLDKCETIIDSNVTVNGHLTAQGLFAPNICYCSSPGARFNGTFNSQNKKKKECEPQTDDKGNTSCNKDLPPQNDLGTLEEEMAKLVDEAKNIYIDRNGTKAPFNVCETKMSPERYQCLKASGKEVPIQMVCGLGVQAIPHDQKCEDANASNDETQANTVDKGCDPNATTPDKRAMSKIKQAENKPGWTYLGPSVNGLTMEQTTAYAKVMASSESTFNVSAENPDGFIGEFQMGAAALIEAGLVKAGTNNRGLDNPANWKNGLSKSKFLNDRQLQHNAFAAYTNKQIQYLGSRFTGSKSSCDKVGVIAAAHLLGPNGSKNLKAVDGNGTSGNSYYDMGRTACRRWTKC